MSTPQDASFAAAHGTLGAILVLSAGAIQIIGLGLTLTSRVVSSLGTTAGSAYNYSIWELAVLQIGSRSVFLTQRRVLQSEGPELAIDFKKATQDQSQMTAVASTILAQIAITALSLENLSQAHWVARGFLTLSLVTSIISVYYSSHQYQILSRCIDAEQVKAWIRGIRIRSMLSIRSRSRRPRTSNTPSVAAVLTISALTVLLSACVHSLIIGLAVYFAYVWTRDLDPLTSKGNSLAVFIVYIVSTSICYYMYFLSTMLVSISTQSQEAAQQHPGLEYTETEESQQLDEARGQEGLGNEGNDNGINMHEITRPGPEVLNATKWTQEGEQGEKGNLAQTLREAALLRRELAMLDSRIADLLERRTEELTGASR